jgi:glycerol-3-phosphate dehydrogenase (NAD+)
MHTPVTRGVAWRQVGRDEFCEATVGYKSAANGKLWQQLFDCPTFKVNIINDPYGVCACTD